MYKSLASITACFFLALPATAQAPRIHLERICSDGELVGIKITAEAAGEWVIGWHPKKICEGKDA